MKFTCAPTLLGRGRTAANVAVAMAKDFISAGADGAGGVGMFCPTAALELFPGVIVTGGGAWAGVAGRVGAEPGGGVVGAGGRSERVTPRMTTLPALAPGLEVTLEVPFAAIFM